MGSFSEKRSAPLSGPGRASVRDDVKRAVQRSTGGASNQATERSRFQGMAGDEDVVAAYEAVDQALRRAGQHVDLQPVAGHRHELDLHRSGAGAEADEVGLLLPVEPLRDGVGVQAQGRVGIGVASPRRVRHRRSRTSYSSGPGAHR